MATIYFIEKNIHGAYVIYGINGIKHYYGYTKNEAIQRYKDDAQAQIFTRK